MTKPLFDSEDIAIAALEEVQRRLTRTVDFLSSAHGLVDPQRVLEILNGKEAAVIGAFTSRLAGPFGDVHEYIERILGRPVFTHELASKELSKEISEAAKRDFLDICAE